MVKVFRKFQRITNNVQKFSFEDQLDLLSSTKNTKKILTNLKTDSVRFFIFPGYLNSKPTPDQKIVHILIIIGLATIIIKQIIFLLNISPWFDTFLGNQVSSFPSKNLLHLQLIGVLLILFTAKLLIFINQIQENYSTVPIIHDIISVSFDGGKRYLNRKNNIRLRYTVLLSWLVYYFATRLAVTIGILFGLYLISNYHSSRLHFIFQLLWSIHDLILIFFGLTCSCWIGVNLFIGVCYCIFALDTLIDIGKRVTKVKSHDQQKELLSIFYYGQNYVYNFIQQLSNEAYGIFMVNILMASTICVLNLFLNFYYKSSDNITIVLILFSLSFFIGLNFAHSIATRLVVKANLVHCLIYKTIVTTYHPLELRIKAMFTLGRLSQRQMGFHVGPLFCLNSYYLLTYILEVASLYILFVVNIGQSGLEI